jgi:hypothetical protein
MSLDINGLEETKQRLSEIKEEAVRLNESIQSSLQEAQLLVKKAVDELKKVHSSKASLADLSAETTFLRLSKGVETDDLEMPKISLDEVEILSSESKLASQPIRVSKKWLEKIKSVDKRPPNPVLTADELKELESRLKDNVCPLCVSFALDGTCTIQSFEKCPIDTYLDRLVKMIEEMGHRPWMEDYFERMYRDICPGCAGRVNEDYCPPKEDGECAIFTYLPTIVKTVETFLQEKKEKGGD